MFLPDGRVLIMDSELFKQTIEKSIVLDLFEGTSLSVPLNSLSSSEDAKKDEEKPGSQMRALKEKKT